MFQSGSRHHHDDDLFAAVDLDFEARVLHDTGIDTDISPLIFDIGRNSTRCGFGGHDSPRCVFPTLVGGYKNPALAVECRYFVVGTEAVSKRGILKLSSPIEGEIVTNWLSHEKLLRHAFEQLKVTPEEHIVVFSDSLSNPKQKREILTSRLFETFNCPGVSLIPSPVLDACSAGRDSGIVVDIGEDGTRVCKVRDGHAIRSSLKKNRCGGKEIDEVFVKLMMERGYELLTTSERDLARQIKEDLCFVSLDYAEELVEDEQTGHCDTEYKLVDGSTMTISRERFMSPEVLFKPRLLNPEMCSLPDLVLSCIRSDDATSENVPHVILSGGSSLFAGIEERLAKDISTLSTSKIEIHAISQRLHSSWIGASILSSMSSFTQRSCVTKDDYDEFGAQAIHRVSEQWSLLGKNTPKTD